MIYLKTFCSFHIFVHYLKSYCINLSIIIVQILYRVMVSSIPNWAVYCYFHTSQLVINSDFDDDHDSPKGEVNPNVLVNCNDISDISKDTVDDNGVSLCLKSLRKTRLCKILLVF